MNYIYLAFLLLTLVCMVICDHRWKLAFFLDATRAGLISIVTVGLFLVWDALGILNAVFYRGDSPYMLGIELAPELPLEEPIFLFFLTYLTLNLTSGSRIFFVHVRRKRILESGGES